MSLIVEPLAIPDVKLLTPQVIRDSRGFFSETWQADRFRAAGIAANFVQDNHAYSVSAHTLRGLHYQAPPAAQAKLIRVLRGSIRDVVVDARRASPTFGKTLKIDLAAGDGHQLFVPAGFLHGYLTLEAHTEISYKVDAYYARDLDGVVAWNDPALGIDWGIDSKQAIVSDRDAAGTLFKDFKSPF